MLIIYPPTVNWDYMKARPHHLMTQFARQGEKVIFCEPGLHEVNRLDQIEEGLWIDYNYPRSKWPAADKNEKTILWISYPGHISKIGTYGEDITVFDAIDYPSEAFSTWEPFIPKILKVSKIVFAVSAPLMEYYKARHSNVHLLQNGVDFDHFNRPGQLNMPDDLKEVSGPIVGFYGALAPWVDWVLVERIAGSMPHTSFVFIGPLIGMEDSDLPKADNIYYIGRREYNKLPLYASYFDVCLFPFKKTEMTKYVSPLKVYEYLAMGKPVVATDIPEVSNMSPYVYAASNIDEFRSGIEKYLQNEGSKKSEERKTFARENTWEIRVKYARKILQTI